MLALVLLPALDRLDLLALDLAGLLDLLRHVSVPADATDLGHVLVALLEGLVVFLLLALRGGFDARSGRGVGAPETHVAVVGAGEHVVVVGRPGAGEDALHALGVVDVAAVALVALPEADAAVVGCRDELFACRGEVDVHDGADVVLEDVEGAGEIAGVENVDVVVFVCDGKVEGFHGIPADGVRVHGQYRSVERCICAEVVEHERAV